MLKTGQKSTKSDNGDQDEKKAYSDLLNALAVQDVYRDDIEKNLEIVADLVQAISVLSKSEGKKKVEDDDEGKLPSFSIF